MDSQGLTGDVLTVDMYDKDCIHLVDGMISSANDIVSYQQLAHFERAASREKLAKLGFSDGQCVMVKSTADHDIENYIYRQVHEQVRQIGIQYKLPIAVNEKLLTSYSARQRQLSNIKSEQIKKVKFLNKAEAQAKYGDKVVFGLIEITV
ncbi:hypothetical protein GCM10027443_33310 [Pontibacter brevis]